MQKYIFHGKVLPERVNFNLYPPVIVESIKHTIIVGSLYSKLTIECDNKDLEMNLETLKNVVESTVRIFVDSIGYTTACGFDVEIESAYNLLTKDITMFGVQEEIFPSEEDLQNIKEGKPPQMLEANSQEIATLMGINIPLRLAMADFRESIKNPDWTAFHCYRSIESLRHDFEEQEEKKQWELFRNSLKIERDTINKIKNSADKQRHGKSGSSSWEERKEQMYITWQIIRRFILFKKDITIPDRM